MRSYNRHRCLISMDNRFSQESPEEGLASRVALFDAGEGSWVTQLAWSDWELVDDRTGQYFPPPAKTAETDRSCMT